MRRFFRSPVLRLRCPSGEVVDAWVATAFASRLLGIAFARELPRGRALLIPDCRSIHTFGMRLPLDVVFLRGTAAVDVRAHVHPLRLVGCAVGGVGALELGAGEAGRLGIEPGRPLRPL